MTTIDDRRKDTSRPWAWVLMTDSFMSGWGHAQGRSLFALAVNTGEEADLVLTAASNRSEMKRPRLVLTLKADGTPKMRLYEGDHLSLRDRGECSRWYDPKDLFVREAVERRAKARA